MKKGIKKYIIFPYISNVPSDDDDDDVFLFFPRVPFFFLENDFRISEVVPRSHFFVWEEMGDRL